MKTQLLYSLLAISAAFANPIEATAQSNIMRRGERYTSCVASAMTEGISKADKKVLEATEELKQFSKCILHGVEEHTDNESAKRKDQFLENFSSCVSSCQPPGIRVFLTYLSAVRQVERKSAE